MRTASGYIPSGTVATPSRPSGEGDPSSERGRSPVLLDKGTLLVKPQVVGSRHWRIGAYDAAGEYVVTLAGSRRGGFWRCPCGALGGPEDVFCTACGEYKAGSTPQENARRAHSRARAEVRRYCAANQLTRLWTLTYREATFDRRRVVLDVEAFCRRLRAQFGDLPYVYVLELHPSGHGWHVHFGLPARFFAHKTMGKLWGHGFVQFADRTSERAMKPLGRARKLARYLAKYLVKDFQRDEAGHVYERVRGEHRYEVAQHFAVVCRRRRVDTLAQAERLVRWWAGEVSLERSSSAEWTDYRGTACYVYREAIPDA
jgi:hypothetical protein